MCVCVLPINNIKEPKKEYKRNMKETIIMTNSLTATYCDRCRICGHHDECVPPSPAVDTNTQQGKHRHHTLLPVRSAPWWVSLIICQVVKSMLLPIEYLLCRLFLAITCEQDVVHKTGSTHTADRAMATGDMHKNLVDTET